MAENVTSSSRRNAPAVSILRVRPEQVTHRPVMRDFKEPIEHSDVIQGFNGRRQSSMQTENLLFQYYKKMQNNLNQALLMLLGYPLSQSAVCSQTNQ